MCIFTLIITLILVFSFSLPTHSQYPPISQLTTITSPVDGNITVNFKIPPKGTCETVFDTQQQYTGWVHVPGSYASNTFFWFIAARFPTDQLTIWLNGGPGSSSMIGLFGENGPCEVIENAQGEFKTQAREWGWDRGTNILYIDQPNQVGFSYDTPTNGSIDLLTTNLYNPPQTVPNSQPGTTFLNGTFSSLNKKNIPNTTQSAGMVIWHALQGFLWAFPQNLNKTTLGVHLFAESYGGKYGPEFAKVWEDQNQKRLNGTISKAQTIEVRLLSLGIINGCVDDLIQAPYWPTMAVNNTYGLTSINPVRANLALGNFYAPGGCKDSIQKCRATVDVQDPNGTGTVDSANAICSAAYSSCSEKVMDAYLESGRSVYDIAHTLPETFPPSSYLEYLNTAEFLAAIGSPVNFTQTNKQVINAFFTTGDHERHALVPVISSLLKSGVRVGFIYGDRDYICNWLGGEAISIAVAAQTSISYASLFPAAGYAPIIVNSSYIGGAVRQYGNLSFSRIYDAGHSVPAYQPETAFQIFARIVQGTSISTGKPIDLSNFSTTGPLNTSHTNSLPDSPAATCYLRNIPDTCTDDQKNKIRKGKGAIINGILYDSVEEFSSAFPIKPTSAIAGSISVTTKTEVLTGFFTATSTPKPKKNSMTKSLSLNILTLNISLMVALILL
ncbi:Carboxypeptidase S1 A [Podosphaera aphanis]|nr:Carboxypeptidase S1 A [Podosphaera aphanis]